MSDAVILAEIRSMRESFEARFLAHEKASSDRLDKLEERISYSLDKGSDRMTRHSDRLRSIETASDTHPALPAVSTPATADASGATPPKALPWWAVTLVAGGLTVAGGQLWPVVVDWLYLLVHHKATP